MNHPRIYIAGPYTVGDRESNIRAAVLVADKLMNLGFVPFTPHLSAIHQLIRPRKYESWINFDLQWLKVCGAVFRLPGKSPGADLETREAKRLGLPVFYSMGEAVAWKTVDIKEKYL